MTSTDLANNALDRIGVPNIDDIDSASDPNAVKAKRAYTYARQKHIVNAAPRFRKEVYLAPATGESSQVWSYVYGYPTDCLDIREIWNETDQDDPRIEFEEGLHSNGSSLTILTNQEDALLIYTADVTLLPLFRITDTDAIEVLMASKLAMSIKRDKELAREKFVEYKLALGVALTTNVRNQHRDPPQFTKYVDVRRG